jgi:transposase
MSETFSKVEAITVARRRWFTMEQKLSVVNETLQPGMSISYVARRHGLSPSLVFRWRRLIAKGARKRCRITTQNTRIPRLGYWSPREYITPLQQAACPV